MAMLFGCGIARGLQVLPEVVHADQNAKGYVPDVAANVVRPGQPTYTIVTASASRLAPENALGRPGKPERPIIA